MKLKDYKSYQEYQKRNKNGCVISIAVF